MFLNEYETEEVSEKEIKHRLSIRFPIELWGKMRDMAKEHYSGRGKTSQLINDALEHFLNNLQVDGIDWSNPENDDNFLELVTQIRLGAQMKNLNPHPAHLYISDTNMQRVIDLDASIRGAEMLMQIHIRPAIIRRAAMQWMHADKVFLDTVKETFR